MKLIWIHGGGPGGDLCVKSLRKWSARPRKAWRRYAGVGQLNLNTDMDGAGEEGPSHSLSLPYRGHGSQAYGSSRRGDGANDPRPGVVTSRQPQSRPRRRRTPESEARAGGGPSLSRRSRLHTLSRRTWSRPAYRDSESAESASSSSSSVDSKSPGPGLSSSQPRQRDGCSGPQSRLSESARAGSVAGFSDPCRQLSQWTTTCVTLCVIPWGSRRRGAV